MTLETLKIPQMGDPLFRDRQINGIVTELRLDLSEHLKASLRGEQDVGNEYPLNRTREAPSEGKCDRAGIVILVLPRNFCDSEVTEGEFYEISSR